MKKLIFILPILLIIFLLGREYAPAHHDGNHHHGVMDKIKAHDLIMSYELDNVENLDTSQLIKVHSKLTGVQDFFTEKRVTELLSFPCESCHNQPLSVMQKNSPNGVKKSHWDIQVVHASKEVMNCTTCHAKDNMNQLVSLTGELIDINESFKLCGQCHSTQLNDWTGGAHGKQLNGWAPPRVAKTCVSCHSPHQPAFPSKFPARLNTKDLTK